MENFGLIVVILMVVGVITDVFFRPRIDCTKDKIIIWYDGMEKREPWIIYQKKV